jgi:hypothetical protein
LIFKDILYENNSSIIYVIALPNGELEEIWFSSTITVQILKLTISPNFQRRVMSSFQQNII